MVAMSDKGLVALELGSNHDSAEEALRIRFPDAEVVSRQLELVDILDKITRVIEEPRFDPELPLDMRGTAYEIEVWSMLRVLPIGETISYGALAAKLGTRDARDVTKAIVSNLIAVLVPCHRVVKRDGSISGYRWGVKRKRELLARERRAMPLPTSDSRVPLSLPNPRGKSPYYACLAGRIGISRWYPFPRNPRENEGGGGVKE
jgi:AraC family transcriptional regulator of adaptative response/methylated-DNA-[protein]-cysteine methyltransferase